MKISKKENKKQTIKISHKEWESIGKKAGWEDGSSEDLSIFRQDRSNSPIGDVVRNELKPSPKKRRCSVKGCNNVFDYDESNSQENKCESCRPHINGYDMGKGYDLNK